MKPTFVALVITAGELQAQLSAGKLTSVHVADSYIAQIQAHNDYLHAVLEISPIAKEIARELDEERGRGILRGPLHGIPLLLKVRGKQAHGTANACPT